MQRGWAGTNCRFDLDSIAVSVFVVDVLVKLTNTVNSTKTSTNTETAKLSSPTVQSG